MNKNGFVFVETIVAIVVLTSSLLLIYSSFTNVLQSEKARVYYDDIAYIYRTYYIKNKLDDLNILSVIRDITTNKDKYFVTVGLEYQDLFTNYEKEQNYFANLLEDFDVKQMILVEENKLNNLKKCTLECSLDSTCTDYENCNSLYMNLSDDMINYLKTVYIDISCTYILLVEYNTCDVNNTNCHNYYSWVSV